MCRYTWKIYSDRLLTLAGVYGFWKYVSNLDRREARRYLEMFYALKYKKLVREFHISMHTYLNFCLNSFFTEKVLTF